METWSGCIPLWWRPSRLWRAMPDALIPNEIDRRDARSWVSNPALKMMTQSGLRRPLKYLPMNSTMAQAWTLIPHPYFSGYFVLRALHSGWVLGVRDGYLQDVGT